MSCDSRRILKVIRALARDLAHARGEFEQRRRRDFVSVRAELWLLESRLVRGQLAPPAVAQALIQLADASVALGASAHWSATARRLAAARRAS